jgi:predicted phosphodiesterase
MKKKSSLIIFILIPLIAFCIFFLILFSLSGTYGIFKWNYSYKVLLRQILIIPLVPVITGLITLILSKNEKIYKIFYSITKALSIIVVLIPVVAIIAIFMMTSGSFSSLPPLLTLTDKLCSNGTLAYCLTLTTEKPETLFLNYYPVLDPQNFVQLKDNEPKKIHTFFLQDLAAGVEYKYELSNGYTSNFTVPDTKIVKADSSFFSFAVSSDLHIGRAETSLDAAKNILTTISRDQTYAFLAILGDFVESGYIKGQWKDLRDFFYENLKNIPLLPVIGNHDAFLGGDRYYKKVLVPQEQNGKKSRVYNHYIYNGGERNIHIISLQLLWGMEDFSSSQKRWLENELEKISKKDFVVILSHCFAYASGYTEVGGIKWYDNQDIIKKLVPIFKKYDVDLVISGHNHFMELIKNDGIIYSIVGAFGSVPDVERTYNTANSLWYKSHTFGFLDVTCYKDYFKINFYDYNNNLLFSKTFDY